MDQETINQISLQALFNSEVIFQSSGHWLFPLFELEDYLNEHPVDVAQVEVRDKVVGKAAAFLLLRLGVGRVHGDLMSDQAVRVLCRAGIPYTFGKGLKRIDCRTEEILLEIDDPEIAYGILCKRANRC